LRQLSQQGLSLLLVEHDLSLVKKICDRVLVLSSGRLLAEGSPEQVMRDPAVITSYLGSEEA
jgi:branched-chain amino acid transport system ATP-binding protein